MSDLRDENPYSDKMEMTQDSPFVGEKTASTGLSGHRDNDPNAAAMEEHATDAARASETAPPLQPKPDLLHDGT